MAAKPRRQASRTRPVEEESPPLPSWIWGASGLGIGLFIALVVYLQTQQSAPEESPVATPAQEASDSGPARPRFDFYTLLPELEVVVPEPQIQPRTAPGGPPPPPAPVQQPGRYLLQAGSFRAQQEADRLRASLAMMGVEARIQPVTVNGDTWHRVQVGPFTDLDNLNRMRERLHANQVQTIMVRVPDA
ncbi:Sporulation related domain-containing protein [Ectothiorhodospira magna]|uniref:Sporulation related domain-containing protein n=1 Tax=Ectothiorhodospira magna TaxID=867345 RepID=A0A1H9C2Y0_9GAMM|nr:SPOR domain-containing protein [Ectothiorhodospira magna]SEP95502.1 Sporulation related domain-containing protein [Ectothiorhodospira magna]